MCMQLSEAQKQLENNLLNLMDLQAMQCSGEAISQDYSGYLEGAYCEVAKSYPAKEQLDCKLWHSSRVFFHAL